LLSRLERQGFGELCRDTMLDLLNPIDPVSKANTGEIPHGKRVA